MLLVFAFSELSKDFTDKNQQLVDKVEISALFLNLVTSPSNLIPTDLDSVFSLLLTHVQL